ncbi:MAG: DUF2254 domain-containing protein [Proteobacteria bacterium]|nr:DUF2254 domain-containing protein [Pseudomonadota bacterium]
MFWLLPAALVLAGIIFAVAAVAIDRSGILPKWLLEAWLYNGGGTGARTLLGAIASSTIGVAGTVFSIMVAALSLAAGQMGPRLLRNFTRDRGNQIALGIFLGTFAYALIVLRTVRTTGEGEFVPHLSLTVAIGLALVCVGTLVYFIHHMSGRINVSTVIDLVSEDVRAAIGRFADRDEPIEPPPNELWRNAHEIRDRRYGYLQHVDDVGLADYAHEENICIRLLVRPGHYVFPGAPLAVSTRCVDGIDEAIKNATALGTTQLSDSELEFSIRQLVEVAVRALSPGINDPYTAIAAIDRLGSGLCEIAGRHLPTNVFCREGRVVLVIPAVDYEGLVAASFDMIRQNAGGQPAIFMHLIDVLTKIADCEAHPARKAALKRYGKLILLDADRTIANPSDLDRFHERYSLFQGVLDGAAQS